MQKLSILSVALLTIMAGAAISPAIPNIAAAFPQIDITYIKMISTIPSLLLIPTNLLTGSLIKKFGKKNILITGLIVYAIGGLGGLFINDFWLLLVSRGILGIGVGLIVSPSVSIISDVYEGQERTQMIGLASACNNLGGVLALSASGILAAISWHYAFLVYILALVSLVLVIVFVPQVKAPQDSLHETDKRVPFRLSSGLAFLAFSMFAIMLIYFTIPTSFALYYQSSGIGDLALTGMYMSLVTLAAFFIGLFFSKLLAVMKQYTLVFTFASFAIGFFFIGFIPSAMTLVIGLIFTGLGLGIGVPYVNQQVIMQTKAHQRDVALSITMSMLFLGQFFSPVISGIIQQIMKITTASGPFIISMVVAILVMIAQFFMARKTSV